MAAGCWWWWLVLVEGGGTLSSLSSFPAQHCPGPSNIIEEHRLGRANLGPASSLPPSLSQYKVNQLQQHQNPVCPSLVLQVGGHLLPTHQTQSGFSFFPQFILEKHQISHKSGIDKTGKIGSINRHLPQMKMS